MTDSAEILINSNEALLRWVATGRLLARECLAKAGFPDSLVQHLELPKIHRGTSRGCVGDSIAWGDGAARATYEFVDATAAAVSMFRLCEWLEKNLETTDADHWRLVTAGANLVDYRVRMLGAHWKNEDQRQLQQERSLKAAKARRKIGNRTREAAQQGTAHISERHARRLKAAMKK